LRPVSESLRPPNYESTPLYRCVSCQFRATEGELQDSGEAKSNKQQQAELSSFTSSLEVLNTESRPDTQATFQIPTAEGR
jgi:hypothetical protein